MATVDPRGVLGDLGAALALTLGAVGASWWFSGAPASYLLIGAAVFGALAALLMGTLPADLAGPGIGAANRVTLVRAALSVPAFAFALLPEPIDVAGLWWVIGLSTAAMILDGVDGWVARRAGSHTSFGARFDMELDAALIMALSVLVWRSGKVGAWALLIGLMRYAFVSAGWIWPALRAELPPSMRRKAVCVIQGVVLLVGLGPIVSSALGATVVAIGLAALTWSFAVDLRWSWVAGRSIGD